MTKFECTQKVKKLISLSTKDEVAKKIGIARATLDARLSWNTWKISEITHIEKL